MRYKAILRFGFMTALDNSCFCAFTAAKGFYRDEKNLISLNRTLLDCNAILRLLRKIVVVAPLMQMRFF